MESDVKQEMIEATKQSLLEQFFLDVDIKEESQTSLDNLRKFNSIDDVLCKKPVQVEDKCDNGDNDIKVGIITKALLEVKQEVVDLKEELLLNESEVNVLCTNDISDNSEVKLFVKNSLLSVNNSATLIPCNKHPMTSENMCNNSYDKFGKTNTERLADMERNSSCNDYEFGTTKEDRSNYIETVTREKPFSCDICNYRCNRKYHLMVHMRVHTGEKPFSCTFCGYKCSRKDNLVHHKRIHTGEHVHTEKKLFSCNVCDYNCNRKHNLVVHMRTHTGEKPFSCNVCEYKCSSKHYLTFHVRKHTGEKPFSCNVCEYKCNNKHYLACHMRIHTGEKPFCCNVCNYRCTQKQLLNVHMKVHTGEKLFSCNICGRSFPQKHKLGRHLKIHT